MLLRNLAAIAILFILCACGSNQQQSPATAQPVSLDNYRFALLSDTINIVLVNETNRNYLTIHQKEEKDPLPLSTHDYKDSIFPVRRGTKVRIVENIVMKGLVKLSHQVQFYKYAEVVSKNRLTRDRLAGGDHVLIEKNKKFYLFTKTPDFRQEIKKGNAYKAIKINLAKAPGYDIIHLRKGVGSGKSLFSN